MIHALATVGNVPVPTKITFREWIKSAPDRVRLIPAEITSPLDYATNGPATNIPEGHTVTVHGKRWTASLTRKGNKLSVK